MVQSTNVACSKLNHTEDVEDVERTSVMNLKGSKQTRTMTLSSCVGVLLVFSLTILSVPASAFAAEDEIDDQDITSHIEVEFWADQAVPANAVNVKTVDGIVTLSGSVSNILAKRRSEDIVAAVIGVRAIINRIVVRPKSHRSPGELEKAVRNALLKDPATDSYEVEAGVNDGVVRLTGTVDSWQEKQLCAAVARSVAGVREVDNQITINYDASRSDYEIQQDVESRLAGDVRVDDGLIEVSIEDGEVILSGTVGSLQEERRAYANAWVAGVDAVETDRLEIQWWARDDMRRRSLYEDRPEEKIVQAVRDALSYDPRVSASHVNVEVEDRRVTLTSIVDNLATRQAAGRDARNTTGVFRVTNNVKVRPLDVPEDNKLKARVATALENDPYIQRHNLDIGVDSGRIYLSGQVHTSWEKQRAASVVETVKGVVRVINNLDYDRKWQWKPDWEIRERVQDELYWSPFVDSDEIEVGVNNGIVTLSGTVDNYSESQSAEDNAYEGGAKDVDNNLTVAREYYGPYRQSPYGRYDYFPPPVP